MTDKVTICNQALRHLGNSSEIQDFDSEKTKEAQACRTFYDTTLDEVLEDFDWSFARRRATLALVATDPNTDWGYAYRKPADAVAVRSLPNDAGIRIDTPATRVSYMMGSDDTGDLIYTDQTDAEVIYTKRETNPAKFPANFVAAFALLLAARIGPSVAGGDQFKLADRAFAIYRGQVQKAQANSANQDLRSDPEPDAEMIRFREGGSSDDWP